MPRDRCPNLPLPPRGEGTNRQFHDATFHRVYGRNQQTYSVVIDSALNFSPYVHSFTRSIRKRDQNCNDAFH
jgi:hypothetical protein